MSTHLNLFKLLRLCHHCQDVCLIHLASQQLIECLKNNEMSQYTSSEIFRSTLAHSYVASQSMQLMAQHEFHTYYTVVKYTSCSTRQSVMQGPGNLLCATIQQLATEHVCLLQPGTQAADVHQSVSEHLPNYFKLILPGLGLYCLCLFSKGCEPAGCSTPHCHHAVLEVLITVLNSATSNHIHLWGLTFCDHHCSCMYVPQCYCI